MQGRPQRTSLVILGLDAEFGFGFAYGVVEAGNDFVNLVAGYARMKRTEAT